jgi:hypothetical protein
MTYRLSTGQLEAWFSPHPGEREHVRREVREAAARAAPWSAREVRICAGRDTLEILDLTRGDPSRAERRPRAA